MLHIIRYAIIITLLFSIWAECIILNTTQREEEFWDISSKTKQSVQQWNPRDCFPPPEIVSTISLLHFKNKHTHSKYQYIFNTNKNIINYYKNRFYIYNNTYKYINSIYYYYNYSYMQHTSRYYQKTSKLNIFLNNLQKYSKKHRNIANIILNRSIKRNIIKDNIESEKREIYYMYIPFFPNQEIVFLAPPCVLSTPREISFLKKGMYMSNIRHLMI